MSSGLSEEMFGASDVQNASPAPQLTPDEIAIIARYRAMQQGGTPRAYNSEVNRLATAEPDVIAQAIESVRPKLRDYNPELFSKITRANYGQDADPNGQKPAQDRYTQLQETPTPQKAQGKTNKSGDLSRPQVNSRGKPADRNVAVPTVTPDVDVGNPNSELANTPVTLPQNHPLAEYVDAEPTQAPAESSGMNPVLLGLSALLGGGGLAAAQGVLKRTLTKPVMPQATQAASQATQNAARVGTYDGNPVSIEDLMSGGGAPPAEDPYTAAAKNNAGYDDMSNAAEADRVAKETARRKAKADETRARNKAAAEAAAKAEEEKAAKVARTKKLRDAVKNAAKRATGRK